MSASVDSEVPPVVLMHCIAKSLFVLIFSLGRTQPSHYVNVEIQSIHGACRTYRLHGLSLSVSVHITVYTDNTYIYMRVRMNTVNAATNFTMCKHRKLYQTLNFVKYFISEELSNTSNLHLRFLQKFPSVIP